MADQNLQGTGGDPRWQPGGQFYEQFHGGGGNQGGSSAPTTGPQYGYGSIYGNTPPGSSTATPVTPPVNTPVTPSVVTSKTASEDLTQKQNFLDQTQKDLKIQQVYKNNPPPFPVRGSIVDFLKSQGKPSDFSSRSEMAKQYGITNYSGTAEQNTQLLGILSNQGTNGVGTANATTKAVTDALNPPATTGTTDTTGQGTGTDQGNGSTQSESDLGLGNYVDDLNQMNQASDDAYAEFHQNLEQLRNGTFPLSSTENAMVSSAQQQIDALRRDQILANQNYVNGVTASTISLGLDRYSPIIAQGMIANAVNVGITKLADLDAKGVKEISELRDKFYERDYKAINDSYDKLQSYLKDRTDTMQKMHDTIAAAAKDLRDFNYKAEQDKISNQLNSDKFTYQQKQDAIDNAFKSRTLDETQRHNLQEELNAKRKTDLDYAEANLDQVLADGDPSKLPGVVTTQAGLSYFDPSQFSDKKQAARAEAMARKAGFIPVGDKSDRDAIDQVDIAVQRLGVIEDQFNQLAPSNIPGAKVGFKELYANDALLSPLYVTERRSKIEAYNKNRDSLISTINALAGSHPRINVNELQIAANATPKLNFSDTDTLREGNDKLRLTRQHFYTALRTYFPGAQLPESGDRIYSSTDDLLKVYPNRRQQAADLANKGFNDEEILKALNY